MGLETTRTQAGSLCSRRAGAVAAAAEAEEPRKVQARDVAKEPRKAPRAVQARAPARVVAEVAEAAVVPPRMLS